MNEQEFVNTLSTRDLVVYVISNFFFVLHLLICGTTSYFDYGGG